MLMSRLLPIAASTLALAFAGWAGHPAQGQPTPSPGHGGIPSRTGTIAILDGRVFDGTGEEDDES